MGSLAIWIFGAILALLATASTAQGKSAAYKRIEVDLHRRTFKLIGGITTMVSPISGDALTKLSTRDGKGLKVLHVIGSPEEDTKVDELEVLNQFFALLCEKVRKVNELAIRNQFAAEIADIISKHLFQKLRIKQLQVHQTKMDAFDLTPLSTLKKLSIVSANPIDGDNAVAHKPTADQIWSLLQNNAKLKHIIVPRKDHESYAAIVGECNDKPKLRLHAANDDGTVDNHLNVTKKKMSAILDSNDDNAELLDLLANTKSIKTVSITVAPINMEADRIAYGNNGMVDPLTWMVLRSDRFYGAQWKQLWIDTPIADENGPQRVQSAIFVLRKRVPSLKKVTVRCISMNSDWNPNDDLMYDVKRIGNIICKDAKMKLFKLEKETRQISYQCTFGQTPTEV